MGRSTRLFAALARILCGHRFRIRLTAALEKAEGPHWERHRTTAFGGRSRTLHEAQSTTLELDQPSAAFEVLSPEYRVLSTECAVICSDAV